MALLYGRELHTKLDLIKPNFKQDMINKQSDQAFSAKGCVPSFDPDDQVFIRNYGVGDRWLPGKIVSSDGTRYYTVTTGDNMCRRHIDQLRPRSD